MIMAAQDLRWCEVSKDSYPGLGTNRGRRLFNFFSDFYCNYLPHSALIILCKSLCQLCERRVRLHLLRRNKHIPPFLVAIGLAPTGDNRAVFNTPILFSKHIGIIEVVLALDFNHVNQLLCLNHKVRLIALTAQELAIRLNYNGSSGAEKAYKDKGALRKLRKSVYSGAYGQWLSIQKAIREAKAEAESGNDCYIPPQTTWLDERELSERFVCEAASLIRAHEIISDAVESREE